MVPLVQDSQTAQSMRTRSEVALTLERTELEKFAMPVFFWLRGGKNFLKTQRGTGVTWWTPGRGPGQRTL